MICKQHNLFSLQVNSKEIDIACDTPTPCLVWDKETCLSRVKCLEKECLASNLAHSHLAESGGFSSRYVHGDRISVQCTDGYTFTNYDGPGSTADITCWYGKWKKLPKCRKFADCELQPLKNGFFLYIARRVDKKSSSVLTLNHGLTAR